MEIERYYNNLAERIPIDDEMVKQGYRMLHDDFDSDWKTGDEPHGTMTFTDEPSPVVITPPVRDLAAEITTQGAEIDQLKVELAAIKIKVAIIEGVKK